MNRITSITDIDIMIPEGRFLVSAVILLANAGLAPKSYNDIIGEIAELSKNMYGDIYKQKPQVQY